MVDGDTGENDDGLNDDENDDNCDNETGGVDDNCDDRNDGMDPGFDGHPGIWRRVFITSRGRSPLVRRRLYLSVKIFVLGVPCAFPVSLRFPHDANLLVRRRLYLSVKIFILGVPPRAFPVPPAWFPHEAKFCFLK